MSLDPSRPNSTPISPKQPFLTTLIGRVLHSLSWECLLPLLCVFPSCHLFCALLSKSGFRQERKELSLCFVASHREFKTLLGVLFHIHDISMLLTLQGTLL